MSKKFHCVLLVDDNADDNFFHTRVIKKCEAANVVIAKQTGQEALDYLRAKALHPSEHPDLIFLDINMPGMNGWEFLEEFEKLDKELQSRAVVIMLTSSDLAQDKTKAATSHPPYDFQTKPLTKEMMASILERYG